MDMKLGMALGRFRKPSLGALPVVLNQPTSLQVTEVAGGRKLTWTNNSEYHSGTYVYRAPTLDPQNLPAPVATVDPVAQGATAEWVDNESISPGDYDYAVQDFDGQGVSALSAVAVYNKPESYASAAIGDEIGGGIYAGTITYADSRQFHIVAAKQSGEKSNVYWGYDFSGTGSYTQTGAMDDDDGLENQNLILTSFDDGVRNTAIYHCRDYVSDGFDDWYLPSRNELALVDQSLGNSHPDFQTSVSSYRASSTAKDDGDYYIRSLTGTETWTAKYSSRIARPIRRVPV